MSDKPIDPGWGLVLTFPDQSPSFAHGFACGRIWEQMRTRGALAISATVVSECRETVEAMAMSLGWIEEFTELADGWLQVDLTKPDGDRNYETTPVVPELRGGG